MFVRQSWAQVCMYLSRLLTHLSISCHFFHRGVRRLIKYWCQNLVSVSLDKNAGILPHPRHFNRWDCTRMLEGAFDILWLIITNFVRLLRQDNCSSTFSQARILSEIYIKQTYQTRTRTSPKCSTFTIWLPFETIRILWRQNKTRANTLKRR